MKIEKIAMSDIHPNPDNAKLHPADQVKQIAESIRKFGFNDPIAIDENGVIIEGHGRYMALQEMGYKEAEVIRITGLTDEQKRAYTLIHNKLTMETGFDFNVLDAELAKIKNIDMADFDFEGIDVSPEDFGEDFTLNAQDHPLVRTISMSLTPEQSAVWWKAINARLGAGGVPEPTKEFNRECQAITQIIHERYLQKIGDVSYEN